MIPPPTPEDIMKILMMSEEVARLHSLNAELLAACEMVRDDPACWNCHEKTANAVLTVIAKARQTNALDSGRDDTQTPTTEKP